MYVMRYELMDCGVVFVECCKLGIEYVLFLMSILQRGWR